MATNMKNLTEVKASTESQWYHSLGGSANYQWQFDSIRGRAVFCPYWNSYSGYEFDVPVCNTSTKTILCILTEPYTLSQHFHRTTSDSEGSTAMYSWSWSSLVWRCSHHPKAADLTEWWNNHTVLTKWPLCKAEARLSRRLYMQAVHVSAPNIPFPSQTGLMSQKQRNWNKSGISFH